MSYWTTPCNTISLSFLSLLHQYFHKLSAYCLCADIFSPVWVSLNLVKSLYCLWPHPMCTRETFLRLLGDQQCKCLNKLYSSWNIFINRIQLEITKRIHAFFWMKQKLKSYKNNNAAVKRSLSWCPRISHKLGICLVLIYPFKTIDCFLRYFYFN